MGPSFFQTMMGKAFYEGTVPRMVRALERIADELVTLNERDSSRADRVTLDRAEFEKALTILQGSGPVGSQALFNLAVDLRMSVRDNTKST